MVYKLAFTISLLLLCESYADEFSDGRQSHRSGGQLAISMRRFADGVQLPGDVRVVSSSRFSHWPEPVQISFSSDESVCFTCSSSLRAWDVVTGKLLRSFTGPNPFLKFNLFEGGKKLLTLDNPEFVEARGWYYGVTTSVPYLRIWESMTGDSQACAPLALPVDHTHLAIDGLTVSERLGRAFVLCFSRGNDGLDRYSVLAYDLEDLGYIEDFRLSERPRFRPTGFILSGTKDVMIVYAPTALAAFDAKTGIQVWKYQPKQGNRIHTAKVVSWPRSFGNNEAVLLIHQTAKGQRFSALNVQNGENLQIRSLEGVDVIDEWRDLECFTVSTIEPHVLGFDARTQSVWMLNLFMQEQVVAIDVIQDLRPRVIKRIISERSQEEPDYPVNTGYALNRSLSAASWSPSGRFYTMCFNSDPQIYLYDLTRGVRIAESRGTIQQVVIGPRGQAVAAIEDNQVLIRSISGNDKSQEFYGPGERLNCVAISDDGRFCAAAGADRTVELWELSSGNRMHSLSGHQSEIVQVAFSRDGKQIVSCDNKGDVFIWRIDGAKKNEYKSIRLHRVNNSLPLELGLPPSVQNLRRADAGGLRIPPMWAISQNAKQLAAFVKPLNEGGFENEFGVDTHLTVKNPLDSDRPEEGIDEWTQDWQGVVKVRDLESGDEQILNPHVAPDVYLQELRFSNDGRLMAMRFDSGQVWIYELKEGTPTLIAIVHTGKGDVSGLKIADDRVLIGRPTGQIEIYSISTLKRVFSHEFSDCNISSLDWIPKDSGYTIVIGTRDRGVLSYETGALASP